MSDLLSLQQLFQERLFRIPDYQRGYAWENKHLCDFWEDLTNLNESRYHYTGLLSLKAIEIKETLQQNDDIWLVEKGYKAFHVVDGQQRLTTISILIFELLSLVKTIPENQERSEDEIDFCDDYLKDIRAKYVMQKRPKNFIITYLFGYETDNPSERYLKYEIFEEPYGGKIDETLYTQNLRNAKCFFRTNLQALYEDEGLTGIERLFRKITQRLKFSVYEIDKDYNEFAAFETMNNRGKQLTNLERFKNRLIYLTTLFDDIQLDNLDRTSLREKINETWKEIYYQLGRNPNMPLSDDDFLEAHWIIYYKYSRKRGDDYSRFLFDKFSAKRIFEKCPIVVTASHDMPPHDFELETDDEVNLPEAIASETSEHLTPEEILHYINSLKEMAEHWYYSFQPNDSESPLTVEEKEWIDKLNRIGINYFRPLVVSSLVVGKKEDASKRVALYQAIERFIFLSFRVVGQRGNWQSSVYYNKAGELFRIGVAIDTIIQELNDTVTKKLGFSGFVNSKGQELISGQGFYEWAAIGYFLYEYEMSLAKPTAERKVEWESVKHGKKDSIEHVLPQDSRDPYWQKQFGQFSELQRNLLLGSLGNLLLLNRAFNSSFSNRSFPEKKSGKNQVDGRGYYNGSHSEIEVSNYDDWTKDSILERGRKLLMWAKDRWNIPFTNDQIDGLLGMSHFEE